MRYLDFPIVIERDRDGYVATCPDLQGCYTQGKTYEEVAENIKEVIALHLEDRRANREKVPELSSLILSSVRVFA